MHAMLALRDLPARQREAWRGLFNHYVFDADESVHEHIPVTGKGWLATLDDAAAKRLRGDPAEPIEPVTPGTGPLEERLSAFPTRR